MKTKAIIIALALIGFSSCKKEAMPQPQQVTVEVECTACAVVFTSNFNPNQLLQVYKKGSYSFQREGLDTMNIWAGTSASAGIEQNVKVTVKVNKKTVDIKKFSGYPIDQKYSVNLNGGK